MKYKIVFCMNEFEGDKPVNVVDWSQITFEVSDIEKSSTYPGLLLDPVGRQIADHITSVVAKRLKAPRGDTPMRTPVHLAVDAKGEDV